MKIKLVFSIIAIALISTAAISKVSTTKENYQYTKGQILSPDYIHCQTLQVVEDFNLPDTCVTDLQIYNFIMSKTETLD